MKLNDKGFSLVQVLISSGFLGAAAVVGIQMMNNQQKVAESTNQRYEIAYIHEEIWRGLQNPLTCESTLKGKSVLQWNNEGIKYISTPYSDGKYESILKTYKTYDSGFEFYGIKNLKINKYKLERDTTSLEPRMNLLITFDRGENTLGTKEITKKVPLTYSTTGGIIDTCNSLPVKDKYVNEENETEESEQATEQGSTQNLVKLSIPTMIGSDTVPRTTLDVVGTIAIKDSSMVKCTPKIQGTIKLKPITNEYVLCNGQSKWILLGKNKINWEAPVKRILNSGPKQSLGEFNYCTLVGVSEVKPSDCELLGDVEDINFRRDWILGSTSNIGRCSFLCYE